MDNEALEIVETLPKAFRYDELYEKLRTINANARVFYDPVRQSIEI